MKKQSSILVILVCFAWTTAMPQSAQAARGSYRHRDGEKPRPTADVHQGRRARALDLKKKATSHGLATSKADSPETRIIRNQLALAKRGHARQTFFNTLIVSAYALIFPALAAVAFIGDGHAADIAKSGLSFAAFFGIVAVLVSDEAHQISERQLGEAEAKLATAEANDKAASTIGATATPAN